MPIMDGIEATKKIKEMVEEKVVEKTTIIAMSAGEGSDEDYFSQGFSLNAPKPVSKVKFAEIVTVAFNKESY